MSKETAVKAKAPNYKGHDSLERMILGHVGNYRAALKFQRGHAKDSDDRSWFDHELSALDDIESACQAVHAEVMSGWIKCSDRLPELDTPVWLRMPENIMIVGERGSSTDGWMWAACYGFYFNADGKWDANDSDASDEYEPTHWQPLPAPPTE